MLCLDSNLVSDHLVGYQPARRFLNEYSNEDLVITATTMVELYMGALYGRFDGGLDETREAIGWLSLDVLEHDNRTALETARLQKELQRRGSPLTAMDAMIGATARVNGATLATNDGNFLNNDVRDVLDIVEYDRDR